MAGRRLTLAIICATACGCQLLFPLSGFDDGADGGRPDSGPWLSDDFEMGSADPLWQRVMDGGAIGWTSRQSDPVHVHRGNSSIHISLQRSQKHAYAQLIHAETLPSHVFVRAFVFMAASPGPLAPAFLVAQQWEPPWYGVSLTASTPSQGMSAVLALIDWANNPNVFQLSQSNFPTGEWVCVEWELDNSVGQARLWLNGTEDTDLGVSNLQMPQYNALRLGWTDNNVAIDGGLGIEAWFDDVYVDTSPVGCAK